MKKLTLEEVKQLFLDSGCEFLDDEYVNNKHPHNYKCECGRTSKISVASFKSGVRCADCGGTKKLTLEEAKQLFLDGGCEFLDDEYVNNSHPHNYKCECGRTSKISVAHFKSGQRCTDCGGTKKLTLEEVKQLFLDGGCEFLDDEYVNARNPHNYKCECGRTSKICVGHFKSGVRCADCGGTKKLTLEEAKQLFLDGGCEFLDDEYVNNSHPHNYKCECGRISKISVAHFKSGQRCTDCGIEKTAFALKFTLEEVKQLFLDKGCEFLDDEYVNAHNPHNYKCECGRASKIRVDDFKSGQRCAGCAEYGFKTSKPSYLYFLEKDSQYMQIGIYNEGSDRLKQHARKGWVLKEQIYFQDGEQCRIMEKKILYFLKLNIPTGRQAFREPFDAYNEAWHIVDYDPKTLKQIIDDSNSFIANSVGLKLVEITMLQSIF